MCKKKVLNMSGIFKVLYLLSKHSLKSPGAVCLQSPTFTHMLPCTVLKCFSRTTSIMIHHKNDKNAVLLCNLINKKMTFDKILVFACEPQSQTVSKTHI